LRDVDDDERRDDGVGKGHQGGTAAGAGAGAGTGEGLADEMAEAATEAHITNYVNLLQQPARLWDPETATGTGPGHWEKVSLKLW